MIVDVEVTVDDRVVELGWTEQSTSLDALDLAVKRARGHVHKLGLAAPHKVEITVSVR